MLQYIDLYIDSKKKKNLPRNKVTLISWNLKHLVVLEGVRRRKTECDEETTG